MKRITLSDLFVGSAAERSVNFPQMPEGAVFMESGGAVYLIINNEWYLFSPAEASLLKTGGLLTGAVTSSSTIQSRFLSDSIFDREIGSHADDSHFDTVSATFPSDWTETTAADETDVSTTLPSFWRLKTTQASGNFEYRKQLTTDFENDVATDEWFSWTFGPILAPRAIWTAPLFHYFSVHSGDGGYQFDTYNRVRLYWDDVQVRYTIRGEYSDGVNSGNSTAIVLGFPLAPLYVRIAMQNSTAQTFRAYVGYDPEPLSMHMIYENNPVAPAVFSTPLYRIVQSRGNGPDSELYLGAVVSQSGVE